MWNNQLGFKEHYVSQSDIVCNAGVQRQTTSENNELGWLLDSKQSSQYILPIIIKAGIKVTQTPNAIFNQAEKCKKKNNLCNTF